ncbi:MAG: HK97 family phage prohead protease [Gemmatimonadales bacterium]
MTNNQLELETKTQRKCLGSIEIKDKDEGQIEAVFSTFNVIDHDGDVTLEGAFEDGAKVAISAYGHASHFGSLPVGRGTIRAEKNRAVLEGQFFLDTPDGRATFDVIKGMGELQEFSYGFDILETGDVASLPEELQSARRVLQKLKVSEVSPVLLGAGIGTETIAIKDQKEDQETKEDEEIRALALKELARFERTRARLLFR